MIKLESYVEFITNSIVHNEDFLNAPVEKQNAAIIQAERQLKNYYGLKKEITLEAVCLQAIWILRIDDTMKRAEQGVSSISLNGISISIGSNRVYISPEVTQLLGRRLGVYSL